MEPLPISKPSSNSTSQQGNCNNCCCSAKNSISDIEGMSSSNIKQQQHQHQINPRIRSHSTVDVNKVIQQQPIDAESMDSNIKIRNNGKRNTLTQSLTVDGKSINNNTNNTNNNNNTTTVKIEHNISLEKPLSQSLNNIANSILYFTHSVEESPKLTSSNPSHEGAETKIKICTCQQSKNYPYCDSTHERVNSETKSNLAPIYLTFEKNTTDTQNDNNNSSSTSNGNNNNDSKKIEKQIPQQKSKELQTTPANPTPIIKQYKPSNIKDTVNQNNIFSLEEIATHNNAKSCWMIIQNRVYDITDYIGKHPGGKNALLRFAGKDGTENVQFHSSRMLQLLNQHYFIGHLRKDQQVVEPSKCVII